MLDDAAPLFLQIAGGLADDIASGTLAEGDRIPSSNEFAAFHRINPATAAKGINILVEQGLVEKRRGIGMFVAAGARATLLSARRSEFAEHYVVPLVAEATRIGIDAKALIAMVRDATNPAGDGEIPPDGQLPRGRDARRDNEVRTA